MAITPDHSYRIVSFALHICRIYIFRYLIDLQNLTAIDFVNAASASALDTELVWVNCFDDGLSLDTCCTRVLTVKMLLNKDFTLNWVVLGLESCQLAVFVQISNLLVYLFCKFFVQLNNRHLFRKRKDKRCA